MTHGKVAAVESRLETERAGRVSRADSVSRAQSKEREREIAEHNEKLIKASERTLNRLLYLISLSQL